MRRTRLALFVAPALLSACTVGPDYRAASPSDLGVPDSYYGAPPAPSPADLSIWWKQLDDPLLDSLVDRAVGGNLDLAVAETRLHQAREALVQARADQVPNIGFSAGVRENIDSHDNSTSYSVSGDAAWEADLFGGIRGGVQAADAEAEGAEYDLGSVRVALIGDVVTNYVNARLAQQRLALARDTLVIANENLEIARWRNRAGLVSALDVEQARGAQAQTAATIPSLERSFSAAAFRLSVLTGQPPGALMGELQATADVPTAPDKVAVGIPAETLRQRPDVRAAERSVAAATARIGVAQAQLYPALRLTGNIGAASLSFGGLVDQIAGSLFAGLTQTLFDGGRLRSQVRSQEAAAEGAVAIYRQTILTGLEDVENGLVSLKSAKERRAQFAIALDAANNQAILARSEYRAGLTDFQTLLEAERALVSARDGMITSHADQTLAFVQLYRALGGGWQTIAPITEARR
jgi:NodT family efflux transporter outer membrane factor (OMF) lipoprotein